MGALSMFENLPLGFRFKPTDVELIDHYLRLKINGRDGEVACIKEVDICRVEPWDLPDLSAIKTNDHEWFFFCPRDRKYPNGQRSNRATGAGYWKATGKDRTIKSRKMGLIGMKKTLVFYTGRAPKGQRTHWVIHEYRTTLQELDGTNPGQGAFVLCRLFKKADDVKPDENEEVSNAEEVETNAVSPHPTIVSQEDVHSDAAVAQASPVSVEQPVEQQMISKKVIVKTSDSITSEAIMPDHSHSYSYGHSHQGSHLNEEMAHEVDSRVNRAAYRPPPAETDSRMNESFKYYNDILEPHMLQQMHMNQGTLGKEPPFATHFGDGYTGLHFQGIDGRDPISDFLDSVLINPDNPFSMDFGSQLPTLMEKERLEDTDGVNWKKASTNESGSCSGSDVDVAQVQHDVGLTGGLDYFDEPKFNGHPVQSYTYMDDDDIFSDAALDRFCNLQNAGEQCIPRRSSIKSEDGYSNAGSNIKLRTIGRQRELPPSGFAQQGTAARRIRLMKFDEVTACEAEENLSETKFTEESCLSADFDESGFDKLDSATVAPDEDIFYLAEISDNPAEAEERDSCTNDGQAVETGIKIRTHLQKTQPSSTNCVQQGTAPRRIRLQRRSGFPSLNAEDDNAKPLVAEIKKLSEEDGQKSCLDGSYQKLSSHKRSLSLLSKGFGQRLLSSVYVMLVIIVCLFMACIGLWRARNAVVLVS